MSEDQRRKLSTSDYQRIHYQNNMGYTIRMMAGEHGISTKYVKKILMNDVDVKVLWTTQVDAYNVLYPDSCSGCNRSFNSSGLIEHYMMYTSGGIKALDCSMWMVR